MFTAIIADDEHKISQLINKLILWDQLGIELITTTDNGKDAFDLICKHIPDIVITDIRMPKMDGLELIRQVKELNIDTKFVVISGYRYFEYAHSALKYGVEDYLLKPINQVELNQVLEKICNEKQNSIKNQNDQITLQEELHISRNALRRELIEKLISNTLETNEVAVVNKTYSLNFVETHFQAITLMLDCKNPEDRDYRQDNFVMNKLVNIINEKLRPYVIDSVVVTNNAKLVCCILNFSKEQQNMIYNIFNSLFSAIQDYVYAYNDYEITMGIGKVENQFSDLHYSIISALEALQYRIIVGTRRKITISDYNFNSQILANNIIKKYKNNLSNIIDIFDINKLCSLIDRIFEDLAADPLTNPCLYYDLANQLTETFFGMLPQENNETFPKWKSEFVKMIPSIYSLKAMTNQLKQKLTMVLKHYEEFQRAKDYKPVRDAKLYIDEHFADKIVLEDISNIVGLNPVYLSVIFKKEVGENFSDYLCNVRIEAAKNLLRNGNHTIAVVAEKVGYKDAKYFSQIFTKIVGVKPAQFRKLYS